MKFDWKSFLKIILVLVSQAIVPPPLSPSQLKVVKAARKQGLPESVLVEQDFYAVNTLMAEMLKSIKA